MTTIEILTDPDASVLCKPLGDLDWVSAVSLRHAIHDAVRPGAEIVIDLSRVSLIDAVGLSAIAGSIRRAQAVGATVVVRNPLPRVSRLMELVGVDRLLRGHVDAGGPDAA
jgi:anti-sigma B factor antagonist